jgi:hypothetical protein
MSVEEYITFMLQQLLPYMHPTLLPYVDSNGFIVSYESYERQCGQSMWGIQRVMSQRKRAYQW